MNWDSDLDKTLRTAMEAPFHPNDLEWRQAHARMRGDELIVTAFAYVTNRAIMNRLDEVVGPMNWQSNVVQLDPIQEGGKTFNGFLTTISIRNPETGEWVHKTDGADNSAVEPVKGGISGASKRAGVSWGIGRYLYELPDATVVIHPNGLRNDKVRPRGGAEQWINWSPPALPAFALPDERFRFTNMQKYLVEHYDASKHGDMPVKVGYSYRRMEWLMSTLKTVWGKDYYLTLAAYEALFDTLES